MSLSNCNMYTQSASLKTCLVLREIKIRILRDWCQLNVYVPVM